MKSVGEIIVPEYGGPLANGDSSIAKAAHGM